MTTHTFTKTIEVFKKFMNDKNLTDKVLEWNGKEYKVSDKQFKWLWDTYTAEQGVYSPYSVTVTNEEGQFSFGYDKSQFHVPRYIPNREQYGKTYFISFYPKQIINAK